MVKFAAKTCPIQGRVGLVTSGKNAGEYIFVWPEIEGRWGYYTSGGGDDILPDAALAERWIAHEGQVRWLNPDEDEAVEREILQLHPSRAVSLTGLRPCGPDCPEWCAVLWESLRLRQKKRCARGFSAWRVDHSGRDTNRPRSATWTLIDAPKSGPSFRWDPSAGHSAFANCPSLKHR